MFFQAAVLLHLQPIFTILKNETIFKKGVETCQKFKLK